MPNGVVPEVVVMDVRLPNGSGVGAAREIRLRRPSMRVLILTSFADDEALLASILAGAAAAAQGGWTTSGWRLSGQEERILGLLAAGIQEPRV
jgi:DNA-binding NarL/FixJ family response regulator